MFTFNLTNPLEERIKVGDVVSLARIDANDWSAEDFGLEEDEFQQILRSQANGDRWIVIDTEANDGLDCLIEHTGASGYTISLRPYHLDIEEPLSFEQKNQVLVEETGEMTWL